MESDKGMKQQSFDKYYYLINLFVEWVPLHILIANIYVHYIEAPFELMEDQTQNGKHINHG